MTDYVWVVHGEAYAENCALSMDTVLKADPGAYLIAYTDKLYPNLGENQKVIQGYHDHPFMLMNVLCQFAHLVVLLEDHDVWFLDSDVLMHKKPDLPDSDITVTWRNDMGEVSDRMPYNYGVIGARKTVGSVAAWAWMANHISRQGKKEQKWYGNQVALRELVGGVSDKPVIASHPWFDVTVDFLPCETYNYTPKDIGEDIDNKVMLHLKGNRKDQIKHYYDRIMTR
jgi:hypothetical protein